jgi:hypothetical protein
LVNYPETLPILSIQLILDAVRGKETVATDRLCHAAWEVGGYALRMSVGQPVAIYGVSPAGASSIVEALEQALAVRGPSDADAGVPWAFIAIELLRLLVEWRLRK